MREPPTLDLFRILRNVNPGALHVPVRSGEGLSRDKHWSLVGSHVNDVIETHIRCTGNSVTSKVLSRVSIPNDEA